MATPTKAASSAKTPASGKKKAVAVSKPVVKTVAAPAKPVKPASRSVVKPVAERKTTAKAPPAKPVKPPLSDEQRRNYIEVAAYYIAERRGFFGTSALEDWAQAEVEVNRMLREGKLNP